MNNESIYCRSWDYKSAQALISQIDNLNKDNNPSFALGVTASAQVLIDAARSI